MIQQKRRKHEIKTEHNHRASMLQCKFMFPSTHFYSYSKAKHKNIPHFDLHINQQFNKEQILNN